MFVLSFIIILSERPSYQSTLLPISPRALAALQTASVQAAELKKNKITVSYPKPRPHAIYMSFQNYWYLSFWYRMNAGETSTNQKQTQGSQTTCSLSVFSTTEKLSHSIELR